MDPSARSVLRQCWYVVSLLCVCALCLKLVTDVSVSGSTWNVLASPSLAHLIQRSAQDVPHPADSTKTLWDARHDVGPYEGPMDTASAFIRNQDQNDSSNPGIGPMGSGSDFTVFLQRLGVCTALSAPSSVLKALCRLLA